MARSGPRTEAGAAPGPAPGWSWKQAMVALGGDHGDGVARMLERAARQGGVSFRTARALYHGESVDPGWVGGLSIKAALAAGGHISREAGIEQERMAAELAAMDRRLAVLERTAAAALERLLARPEAEKDCPAAGAHGPAFASLRRAAAAG